MNKVTGEYGTKYLCLAAFCRSARGPTSRVPLTTVCWSEHWYSMSSRDAITNLTSSKTATDELYIDIRMDEGVKFRQIRHLHLGIQYLCLGIRHLGWEIR